PVLRAVARFPSLFLAAGLALTPAAPARGASAPAPVDPDSALTEVRRLADAGAPRLALSRIERLQPEPHLAPWAEWEALRFELLARLDDRQALYERAGRLSPDAPAKLTQTAFGLAARLALEAGETRRAADFLRRQLWWSGPPEEPIQRNARRRVIDAYLAERRARDAYRAMLRFQQDFRPLTRDESEGFVRGLAWQGLGKEALSFAAGLDPKHPLVIHAELGAGITAPSAALGAAKAALARGVDLDALKLELDAARRIPDRTAEVDALERLLNRSGKTGGPAPWPDAGELAEAYGRLGQELANGAQLLVGEDAAWLATAEKIKTTDPRRARALWALLAKQGRAEPTRRQATALLLDSLAESKLALTAVRLFAAGSPLALSPGAAEPRRKLARMATDAGAFAAAADYLQGTQTPPETSPAEWALERARVLLAADRAADAEAAVLAGDIADFKLPTAAAERALDVGERLLGAGELDGAGRVLQSALQSAGGDSRRGILFALGRLRLAQGKHAEAADFFMRCALANGADAVDALAVAARTEAAASLAAAGWSADAQAQWRWLLKNVRDPGFRELLQREAARHPR
ncbi:MAG TPA: hypothetical protein VLW45_05075, partial [Pelomicrobium sp.]|nr:hypothetical protein [Pelomicrobium sp.]